MIVLFLVFGYGICLVLGVLDFDVMMWYLLIVMKWNLILGEGYWKD